jgi:RNA recognition motif-containing protein
MMQVSRFALFLGDLSMHCSEADLEEAFAPYGTIVEIRVKRSKETAKTLSYGFLEFASASSAVNAMNDMDGVVLKGRPLR